MTASAPASQLRTAAPIAPPVAAALERALTRAARLDGAALVRVALPAPVAPAAALLAIDADADALVWEPRDGGTAWAGAGVAATVTARGDDRFTTIIERAAAIAARIECIDDAPAPRWFGGFAFAPGSADLPPWRGFGDASFVLPRWSYLRDDDRARLVLTLGARPDVAAVHAELAAVLAALHAPAALTPALVVAQDDLPAPQWHDAIERIRAAIADGGLRKVVAARARGVELARAIDPAAVVVELGRRQPACTRFAIARGGATFVGASPERLIRKRGRAIDSEALAGSCARSGDDVAAAAALLASGKDRGEHRWVVEAIEAALAPRCAALAVPAVPVVRTLRQILHLHTPITGELDRDRHVLELVAALHPTPAVGGTPTADAVAWIARHEPARGWYAAPVGWFDGDGDGEFAVAIRSGLIAGARATLYAGAGIVGESDPEAELAETELKLRALSGALGLDDVR